MSEIQLINQIIDRLKSINEGHQYKAPPNGILSDIQYFKYDLPAKRSNPGRPNQYQEYPFIIVRPTNGKMPQSDENIVDVTILIGVWDEDTQHQGHEDAILIMQRIRMDLIQNPILNNGPVFDVDSFAWTETEGQAYPYYNLAITTSWFIQAPQWTQHSELI